MIYSAAWSIAAAAFLKAFAAARAAATAGGRSGVERAGGVATPSERDPSSLVVPASSISSQWALVEAPLTCLVPERVLGGSLVVGDEPAVVALGPVVGTLSRGFWVLGRGFEEPVASTDVPAAARNALGALNNLLGCSGAEARLGMFWLSGAKARRLGFGGPNSESDSSLSGRAVEAGILSREVRTLLFLVMLSGKRIS